jgi:glycosyltransferase involved in cell wall biosynthesis
MNVSDAAREEARKQMKAEGFVVTFAGNLGYLQGVETIVEAASLLRSRADIAFRIIGDGALRSDLERMAADLRVSNLAFLGTRSPNVLPAYLEASDALVVHLRAGELNELVMPAKTLSYLAAGRPLIVAATGAAETLVNECGAGLTLPPGDPAALAQAIEQLFSMTSDERVAMGRRGRECAESRFARTVVMNDLEQLLVGLAR